jgi:hypothetical protein
VVSYTLKRDRFMGLHRAALRWPAVRRTTLPCSSPCTRTSQHNGWPACVHPSSGVTAPCSVWLGIRTHGELVNDLSCCVCPPLSCPPQAQFDFVGTPVPPAAKGAEEGEVGAGPRLFHYSLAGCKHPNACVVCSGWFAM